VLLCLLVLPAKGRSKTKEALGTSSLQSAANCTQKSKRNELTRMVATIDETNNHTHFSLMGASFWDAQTQKETSVIGRKPNSVLTGRQNITVI